MTVLKKTTVAFETATYALKAKKILMKAGLEAVSVKINRPDIGCTHGITVNERDLYTLIGELKARDIYYTVVKDYDLSG